MPLPPKPENPTEARMYDLLAEKKRLEGMIPGTIDLAAQSKLRADFREVCDELELYYPDLLTARSHVEINR